MLKRLGFSIVYLVMVVPIVVYMCIYLLVCLPICGLLWVLTGRDFDTNMVKCWNPVDLLMAVPYVLFRYQDRF